MINFKIVDTAVKRLLISPNYKKYTDPKIRRAFQRVWEDTYDTYSEVVKSSPELPKSLDRFLKDTALRGTIGHINDFMGIASNSLDEEKCKAIALEIIIILMFYVKVMELLVLCVRSDRNYKQLGFGNTMFSKLVPPLDILEARSLADASSINLKLSDVRFVETGLKRLLSVGVNEDV